MFSHFPLKMHTSTHSVNTFPDAQSFRCRTEINADPRSCLQPGPLQPLTDSSDHSWESKSCSGIALQFSGARITWSWTDPEHWSLWNWVRNVWRGLLNELAGYQHPWSGLLQRGRLFDSTGPCLGVGLPSASPVHKLVSTCREEKCPPKTQGGARYPEQKPRDLVGFASHQDRAASWGRYRWTHKNKRPFIQQIYAPPQLCKTLPNTSKKYSNPSHPPLFFISLVEYLFLLQGVVLPFSCS